MSSFNFKKHKSEIKEQAKGMDVSSALENLHGLKFCNIFCNEI